MEQAMKNYRIQAAALALLILLAAPICGKQNKNAPAPTLESPVTVVPPKEKQPAEKEKQPADAGKRQSGQTNNAAEATDSRSPNRPGAEPPIPPATLTEQLKGLRGRIEELESRQVKSEGKQGTTPASSPGEADQTGENPVITRDYLGPLDWFTSSLLFWPFVGLVFLALGLHVLHFLKGIQMSRDIDRLSMGLASGNRVPAPTPAGNKNLMVDKLTEQVNQQGQGLSQFTTRLNQLENRMTLSSTQVSDAVQAVALTANWIGQSHLREARAADGNSLSEGERTALIAMLERYREPLRVNASRVEPLAQALAELVEKMEGRTYLSPELMGRVQSLYEDIGRFDQWHQETSGQMAALQRGSFSQRSLMLQTDQQRLIEEVHSGSLSVAQMVQKSRALLEQHFPDAPARNGKGKTASLEQEPELKKLVTAAPDYLMDWFNNLFQLQNLLLSGGQRDVDNMDGEIIHELSHIQKIAREALSKFDIQPEAIQLGQTSYDRRLHDATMVRQSSQFPINTVIEVHQCGFRRMSTGEVLRRPQVVVAGATAT
jgi:uncharacterized protein YoxC